MSDDGKHKRWFPLESNPEVMNSYVDKMGFPTSQFSFCDVLSTEEWALAMVPTPVVGVIMLFPIKAHTEEADKQEAARIEKDGQTVSPNVYYMRQTVGNACGTVGILHAIGNMRHLVQLTPGSYLDKFFNKTKTKSPEEIAQYLEEDDELEETHGSAAEAGQSEQLESVDDPINTHFVCFSCVDGNLYELDGRKKRPINHGPSSPDTVLQDACQVIKKFMAQDEGEQQQQQQLQSTLQQEVRIQNKLEVNKQIPINVYLRAGRYELSDTFDFTDDDSGAADEAPVTYQAYCDAAVEKAAISTRSFPYRSGSGIPPRLLWNGVGDIDEWVGPVDPFAQMGVNRSANSLLVTPASAQDVESDIGTVCVDKNNGVGHTCYAQDSPMATCVSGCMTACQSHIARKRYSEKFYNKFTHLFGKDLRKEEDCVEICSLSCRGYVVASQVLYNATTFSSRVSTWTNVKEIMAELRPQSAQPTSLHYSLSAFDTVTATLQLGAGGSELSYDIFTDGPGASWSSPASLDPAIRVENVFQELDSPGEWFFDVSTRQLYLIPLKASTTATSLAKSVLEIPLLHQLLRVSGTHERIPGSAWPMTRVASIFLESVTNTTIEYCSFEKIGGNAILVSGENSNIQITNNNVSFVGSNGISVLGRRGFQLNSFHEPVLSHLLVPRAVNISFNQVHHFGQQVAHSAAIMVVGAKETTIHGNLVFDAPTSTDSSNSAALFTAAAYHVTNAKGVNYKDGLPLIRPISNLGEKVIPITPAPVLSSQYQVTVPLLDFDVNIVAKLLLWLLLGAQQLR
ncbi:hypothetical protein JG688_00006458 [Phytophthora aleatoria]|uniref:ubiquitinyl hydrolase 1 n=1 Tax=Phytophthora aleatoria TaxID=2496075 RepID=A0A8J5J0X1_9STRA|nr:hypothetical protein JG688_00006458 [Phytophthora aleatoria]